MKGEVETAGRPFASATARLALSLIVTTALLAWGVPLWLGGPIVLVLACWVAVAGGTSATGERPAGWKERRLSDARTVPFWDGGRRDSLFAEVRQLSKSVERVSGSGERLDSLTARLSEVEQFGWRLEARIEGLAKRIDDMERAIHERASEAASKTLSEHSESEDRDGVSIFGQSRSAGEVLSDIDRHSAPSSDEQRQRRQSESQANEPEEPA